MDMDDKGRAIDDVQRAYTGGAGMSEPSSPSRRDARTRFGGLTRMQAGLWLCGLALLIGYGFACLETAFPVRASEATDGEDARMYRSVIERVQAGGAYYAVVGEELRTRGYASRPFFNWRLPTMAWLHAALPHHAWGRWILSALAGLTLVLWFQVLERDRGFRMAVLGCVLLCGPLLLCVSEKGFYYHELWAGVCIILSFACYARGWWIPSIVVGTFAVCVRELALPYLVIMFAVAWWEQRRYETIGWLVGLTCFMIALTWHASIVSGLLIPADQVNESWVQFGGWSFLLSTGNWNVFLLASPHWMAAVVLPLALLGVLGWRGHVGLRGALILAVYYGAFLIAGRTNNSYWGLMYAPLIPLGLLYACPAINDLIRTLLVSRPLTHHDSV